MSVFDTGLPSVRQIQSFIKNKQKVEIGLSINKTLKGQVLWQDPNCICLKEDGETEKTLILLQSIVYLKPESLE